MDEEGNPVIKEEEPVDDRLPEMEIPQVSFLPPTEGTGVPDTVQQVARTAVEQARVENLHQCQLIKEKLARDGVFNTEIGVIERAVMMPPEQNWLTKDRKYPNIQDFLMVNPFPKVKKGKKGKKGKKK